ncbi:hypothetical protein VTJ83DRAFT_2927 [Remersonia thermophila]|uniref:Glycosyl transferase CAP10 domain-containing protein n=1 Tax=Remersonia thermophila TaxID=72144 RepID=A0ABR4DCL4_9PEZI
MAPLRRLTRILLPAVVLIFTLYALARLRSPDPFFSLLLPSVTGTGTGTTRSQHPIDELMRAADAEFAALLAKQTTTLAGAAAAYRRRRGRHPPPGFDAWHAFAAERGAVVVEDFWDPIYADLEPLWGEDPATLRARARDVDMRIAVRGGRAEAGSDWFWTRIWLDMLRGVEGLLPDMEIALNAMDEPRVVVPWEEVDRLVKKAGERRKMVEREKVVEEFARREAWTDRPEGTGAVWEHEKHYWLIARRGCPPESAARTAPVVTSFNRTPLIASSFDLAHMRRGYVANHTLSTSFCHQPDLQALEGIFVEPLSVSATASLVPVFGGSKLAVNNDILLPAPMYWNEEERFTGAQGANLPWRDKTRSPAAVWRGVATGGRHRDDNWRSFQRHRFVAMNNASQVAAAAAAAAASSEQGEPPENLALPDPRYRLAAGSEPEPLARWLAAAADVAFTDLMCADPGSSASCSYASRFFAPAEPVPMARQFRHRILPDVDGNSFSGRYLGFLRSTSLPVKATLWREWHDARLVAWRHFVPMDSRFGDWYGILEYFAGNEALGVAGHETEAERIAMQGREWAGRVLRREDMQVYVLRLLLEYARVVDPEREVMGWVGDLA